MGGKKANCLLQLKSKLLHPPPKQCIWCFFCIDCFKYNKQQVQSRTREEQRRRERWRWMYNWSKCSGRSLRSVYYSLASALLALNGIGRPLRPPPPNTKHVERATAASITKLPHLLQIPALAQFLKSAGMTGTFRQWQHPTCIWK